MTAEVRLRIAGGGLEDQSLFPTTDGNGLAHLETRRATAAGRFLAVRAAREATDLTIVVNANFDSVAVLGFLRQSDPPVSVSRSGRAGPLQDPSWPPRVSVLRQDAQVYFREIGPVERRTNKAVPVA